MSLRHVAAMSVVLVALVAACTRAEKGPAVEPPTAKRDPAVTGDAAPGATTPGGTTPGDAGPAGPDPSAWTADWPKSWTDPRVVAALAADCAFVPVRPRSSSDGMGDTPADIFKCSLGYEQSCTIDPCITPQSACETKCEGTCGDCGGSCVKDCTTCKSRCTDDACKKACATSCGACKQTCTRTMDRCVTGECARIHAACKARLVAMWNRSGCKARCAVLDRCQQACTSSKEPAVCNERCERNMSPGFKACDARCDELREKNSASAEGCLLSCYQTVPCAPFLCGWSPSP